MFDPNKPYQLRCGSKCEIKHIFKNGDLFVVYEDVGGGDAYYVYPHSGRYTKDFDSSIDLVNIPEKIEEEKTFNPNKPYSLRDGRKCEIIYTFKNGNLFVVHEDEESAYYPHSGRYYKDRENSWDLVNIHTKIEGWVNVHKGSCVVYLSPIYATKELADNEAAVYPTVRSACIKISFTEGEGL